MSFSISVKNELARIKLDKKHCKIAELAGLVRMIGTIQMIGLNGYHLKFNTENASIARRLFTILKELYDGDIEVMVRKNRQLKKNNNYLIVVNDLDVSKRILIDVGFLDKDNPSIFDQRYKIDENLISKRCCKRSYIRGAFLGAGSLNNPEKTYHLEFVTNDEGHAEDLSSIVNSFGLNSKIVKRKENHIVYLKESEQIADLLNIVGAYQSLLKLEDIRVLKDVRNNINRIVNCETANLSKTINAAMKQIENIRLIQEKNMFEKLPKQLREIAELRLDNPDASLKELGELLNPVVGKSGVNHRLKKLEQIAKELKGEI